MRVSHFGNTLNYPFILNLSKDKRKNIKLRDAWYHIILSIDGEFVEGSLSKGAVVVRQAHHERFDHPTFLYNQDYAGGRGGMSRFCISSMTTPPTFRASI